MTPGRVRDGILALYGIGLAFSISGALGAGYLLAVFWGVRAARGVSAPPRAHSPLEAAVLAYFAWGFAVTVATGSAGVSKAISAQGALLLFLMSVRDLSVKENQAWILWLCVAGAASGAFAALQAGLGIDRIPTLDRYLVPDALASWPQPVIEFLALRDGRATATRSHPLTFAEGLLISLFILLALQGARTRAGRAWKAAGAALMVVGIGLSLGRGVWLGLIAGGAVLATLWWDRRGVRAWTLAAVAGIALSVALVPRLRERAVSIVRPAQAQAQDQASRSTRFLLWSAAADEIRERPVAGHGIKGLKLVITEPGATEPRAWSEAHNIFLQVLGERGLVGLGLFLWMLALCFRVCAGAPPGWREGGLALLAGLMVAGLSESWVKDKEVDMLFWAVMGAIERARLERGA